MSFKTAVVSLFFALMSAASLAQTEVWDVRMSLRIPRVYDNTQSKGYRKYQLQRIEGYIYVERFPDREPEVQFCSLVNYTHKINGKNVTYDTMVDSVLWHGIGSNRTCVFNKGSVSLDIVAEPSYSIGEQPTEDNSLWIRLSGYGNNSGNMLRGYVAGQLGCGCAEYGHISPTRIWKTSIVVDTAAVCGTWKARRVQ